jgi:hypothetical protein
VISIRVRLLRFRITLPSLQLTKQAEIASQAHCELGDSPSPVPAQRFAVWGGIRAGEKTSLQVTSCFLYAAKPDSALPIHPKFTRARKKQIALPPQEAAPLIEAQIRMKTRQA